MTTHQPIEFTPALFICPICAWRGVLTTAGLVTTEAGDATADHRAAVLAQQQQARDTAERIMTRLREQYASGAALPEVDDNTDDLVAAGVRDRRVLTLQQMKRLFRCVVGEFRT